jgi:hypothetical protein
MSEYPLEQAEGTRQGGDLSADKETRHPLT